MRNILFVSGIPRSGTTIMKEVLDSHPLVSIRMEQKLILQLVFFLKELWYGPQDYPVGAIRQGCHLGVWDEEFFIIKRQFKWHIRSMWQEVFEEMTDKIKPDAIWMGDKIPGIIRDYGYLFDIFPEAKWVVMKRDADALWKSISKRWTLTQLPQWERNQLLGLGLEVIESMKKRDNVLIVEYDDFCLNPKETAARLARFLAVGNEFDISKVHANSVKRSGDGNS